MKKIILAAALMSAVSLPAYAQSAAAPAADAPSVTDTATPSVDATATQAPAASALDEDKVKELVTAAGYTDPGKFAQDENGNWKGAASKDGTTVSVSVDAAGTVTAE
jgi:hypothetical protein